MAKESYIRKKALEVLDQDNWVYWYPSKVKFQQNDVFGVFDLVCCKKGEGDLKFIQLTTTPNLAARRKKIKAFLKENKVNKPKTVFAAKIEIWAWANNHKRFKVEEV